MLKAQISKPAFPTSGAFSCIVALLLLAVPFAWTEDAATASAPDTADVFMGDWQGRWESGEKKHPDIAAQVIAMGNNEYQVTLLEMLYQRVPPMAVITAAADAGALHFDDGFYFGEIKDGHFTGGRRGDEPGAFVMEPFFLKPPSWALCRPTEPSCCLTAPALKGGKIPQRQRLGCPGRRDPAGEPGLECDRDPTEVQGLSSSPGISYSLVAGKAGTGPGQQRVFLQEYYEIQILDSYGLPGYWNECGAIYRISAPYVNMCLPPLQWQTYDIEFRAARFDAQGNLAEKARVTVLHNGVAVQKDHEIPRGTSGDATKPPVSAPSEPGPIRLQAHKNQVQFRNVWVVDLSGQH